MKKEISTRNHTRTAGHDEGSEEEKGKFMRNVNKTASCWLWMMSKNRKGYGQVKFRGRSIGAHRASWLIHHGDIPHIEGGNGMCVLHKCDVPACVNPAHLFLGSDADNVADRDRKGRNNQPRGTRNGKRTKPEATPKGSTHYITQLSEADVIAIRTRRYSGEKLISLASSFGVGATCISMICRRKNWKHI